MKSEIEVHDIVQLDPETTENRMFAGCLLTVTKVRGDFIQGYVQALGENGKPGGQAYYRATWGTFMPTGGKAPWVV